MSLLKQWGWMALAAGSFLGVIGSTGCTTDAFCFADCTPDGGSGNAVSAASGSGGNLGLGGSDAGCLLNCGGGSASSAAASGSGGGCDYTSVHSCGTCDNDCFALVTNWDPKTIMCAPSKNPGVDPGVCSGTCSADYYDIVMNGKCEYYCVLDATDPNDKTCDGVDQNCNGVKDEGVDVCSDVTNCGKCGGNCVVQHGTPACTNSGMKPCDPSNTQCSIQKCDCNGPGDCWWDLDNSYGSGCEYQCDVTNGGVEICDGIDNDCNGKIDAADPNMVDPTIGIACFGGAKGECAAPAHAGVSACQGGKSVCIGANVLVPNQTLETCNGLDDDCDGVLDNNPTDAGGSCGVSNSFPCQFGTKQCKGGALVCIGETDPGIEVCNGIDDNCDGAIDLTGNMAPADSIGACNVPLPPPAGATSPCKAGAKACVGGTVQCLGSVGPVSPSDTCGVDANCDGLLTGQPNTMTDVHNCGSCGNDCLAGAVHSNWACVAGACSFQGCQAGYFDLSPVPKTNKCTYPCVFVSAQESCNGVDDNCNGTIDEGVIPPSPVQVCGVSPSAMAPECTGGVGVACTAGAWKCTFPAGVCNPTCAGTAEICDTLDNNCNGVVNENVPNYGKPCASDDGKSPGDGACRTTGTFACSGANATACSAVKANCAGLPGGCTELCDGKDNDCDGLVDEPFSNKGSNANFVKPVVVKTGAIWIYAYEASRPNATNVIPGSGDGYECAALNPADPNCNDAAIPVAPAGVTLDKTPACSVTNAIPWFNVKPPEAEQTCKARGGSLCTTTQWQTACKTQNAVPCTLGYAPQGVPCTSPLTAAKYCNLGLFDFDGNAANGVQNGLLPTASALLKNCFADWTGNADIFDITGNLHEITKSAANTYPLMGGAFNTQSEAGALCSFQFYTVDQNYSLYDTGFRCCFTADPTM